MILVDSNVLMYAGGAEHPNREAAARFIQRVGDGDVNASIDAEVLQEILHRYLAINRWEQGRLVYIRARRIFPDVLPVTAEVLDRAKEIVDSDPTISARDAVHAAVVRVYQMEGICSFDRDFDRVRGCKRIEPS